MSEEEQEAIKELQNKHIFFSEYEAVEDYETENNINTILNLIEKQQKEIEEWQKAYIKENNYWLKFRNKINKIANNDKDCSDNEVIKAVKELKEKNASLQKEIKLMKSININDNYISKDKVRAKINWLESQFDEGIESEQNQFIIDCVAILEELLED